MSKSILAHMRNASPNPTTVVGKINQALTENVAQIHDGFSNESGNYVEAVFGSAPSESTAQSLSRLGSNIEASLESMAQDLGIEVTQAARDSFMMATAMALNPAKTYASSKNKPQVSLESGQVQINTAVSGEAEFHELGVSLEAFDESALRTTTVYSQQLALRHGNQDEFAETWFPTVVVPNNEAGYAVSLPVVQVQDDITRDISGKLNDFRRRNIVHAIIDPSIIRDDQTKLVPIYRTESASYFVDSALVTPRTIKQDGKDVVTAPLAIGKTFSILGISQSDAQLAVGGASVEDSVDSGVTIENLYIKIEDGSDVEVIKLRTTGIDGNNFWAPPQGDYRTLRLAFDTKALSLRGKVKKADDTDSTLLAAIDTGGYTVGLSINVTGKLDTDLGDMSVNASDIVVTRIFDGTEEISLSDASVSALVDLIQGGQIIGYDIDGYRTNSNRRQRGQLLNNHLYTQIYATKRRAPVTVPRPQVGSTESREASDLSALMTYVGIATTNSAIEALMRHDELLAQNITNDDLLGAMPNVLGIAHSAIRGYYSRQTIDVKAELQTLNSTDKVRDTMNVFINRIRDEVFKAYVSTGYKAAANARHGGNAPKPLVLIGTDPRIAAYIQLIGDVRTLGDEFNFRVVSTLNKNMANRIYVSFGVEEALTSGQAEPFHFGNMGWTTPLVYALPTHYAGSNVVQTSVQPDYIHVVNLPVLVRFDVQNLAEAIEDRIPVGVVNP